MYLLVPISGPLSSRSCKPHSRFDCFSILTITFRIEVFHLYEEVQNLLYKNKQGNIKTSYCNKRSKNDPCTVCVLTTLCTKMDQSTGKIKNTLSRQTDGNKGIFFSYHTFLTLIDLPPYYLYELGKGSKKKQKKT